MRKRILVGHEREYALPNGHIREVAGLTRDQRRVANMVRHARELELGRQTNPKFKTLDRTPSALRLSGTVRREDCRRLGDTLSLQYAKDRVELDKMCRNKH